MKAPPRGQLIAEAARLAADYLCGAAGRGVVPTAQALADLARFKGPFPASGRAAEEVLAELAALGSPATVVSTHGRYFGFVNGGTDAAAQAASVLMAAWDQNVALPVMSP